MRAGGPRPALHRGRPGPRRRPGRRRSSSTITYSPKVFIPVTRLCRDRCHYCTFVTTPGHLARAADGRRRAVPLPRRDPRDRARGRRARLHRGAVHSRGPARGPLAEAREWLDEQGYDSTLAYVRAMAVLVLEETGLLPHLNPGVMSWEEMNRLKPVSPSMGMMLDDLTSAVRGEGQRALRLPRQGPRRPGPGSEDAGRLSVPFTTGLLIGIGRTSPSGRSRSSSCAGWPGSTATSRKSSSRTSGPSPTPRCGTSTTSGSRSTSRRSPSPGSCSDPRCEYRRRPTSSTSPSARRCSAPASTTGAGSRR